MALDSTQIAWTARIVREAYAVAESKINSLNPAQEDLLVDDIDLYESIENSHVKFTGDGVDFDNERKREAIFYRVRQLLDLPFVVYDLNEEVLQLIELELGQNFS